jgi:hypothetical protein
VVTTARGAPSLAEPTLEAELGLDQIQRLTKALRESAVGLAREEAGYLVDVYYRFQQHRIAMNNQVSSLTLRGRPDVPVLTHFYNQTHTLEKQLVNTLGTWAASRAEGEWAQEQLGIGPVLSAALSAYIDIEKAPVAGNIHRFAGLDSSIKWIGAKASRELVSAALAAEPNDIRALAWLARSTNRALGDILEKLELSAVSREEAQRTLSELVGDPAAVAGWFESRPIKVDNAILLVCDQAGLDPKAVYEEIYGPDFEVGHEPLIKLLAKRPYSAQLKVICWKIGDSFCKVSGREGAYYGKVYKEAKAREVDLNEQRAFADQAAESLATRRIQDKALRRTYEDGRLPAGRIELRARRRAVKLFLSHWHTVAYWDRYDKAPPLPYAIQHLGHAHYIPVPGRDFSTPTLPVEG